MDARIVSGEIPAERTLAKRYSIRRAYGGSSSFEVGIPKIVLEREARARGLSIEEFIAKFEAECLFDEIPGVYYRFVPRE